MKTTKKIYASVLKFKAIELSNERSNVTELVTEVGIRVTMLYKWRKEYEKFGAGSFPRAGTLKLSPEQKIISDLQAKLKDAELKPNLV